MVGEVSLLPFVVLDNLAFKVRFQLLLYGGASFCLGLVLNLLKLNRVLKKL